MFLALYFDCVLTRLDKKKYQIHMLSWFLYISFRPKRKKKQKTKYTFVMKKKKNQNLSFLTDSKINKYAEKNKKKNGIGITKLETSRASCLVPIPISPWARPFVSPTHKKAPANYWSANADTTTTCPWRAIKKVSTNPTRQETQPNNPTQPAQLEELLLSFSRADEDAIARFSVDCTL
jgi:hypothetical protein